VPAAFISGLLVQPDDWTGQSRKGLIYFSSSARAPARRGAMLMA
jgi:hypothetical protein